MTEIDIHEISGCACAQLRRTTRRITQLYDHALLPVDLTVNQFGLLGHLYGAKAMQVDGLSIKILAERLGMDPSTLTRNLKPLEARGLISDRPDPSDGRARLVAITAKGCNRLAEAVPLWRMAQSQMKQKLGTARLKELGALLDTAAKTPLL